jgi:hypothetical protein
LNYITSNNRANATIIVDRPRKPISFFVIALLLMEQKPLVDLFRRPIRRLKGDDSLLRYVSYIARHTHITSQNRANAIIINYQLGKPNSTFIPPHVLITLDGAGASSQSHPGRQLSRVADGVAYITFVVGRHLPWSRGRLGNLFTLTLGHRKFLIESASVGRIHIIE